MNEKQPTTAETTANSMNRRQILRGAGGALGALTLGSIGTSSAAASQHNIQLGEDTTFTDLNRSKAGNVVQGITVGNARSTANRTIKRARAEVNALTGVGIARYWAEVGRLFVPQGDSPQLAELTTRGTIRGDLRALIGSGASVIIYIKVNNFTEGRTVRESIFRAGGNNIGNQSIDQEFTGSLTTQLRPDHRYTVWARLHARVDTLTSDIGVLPASRFYRDDRGMFIDDFRILF